jgi:hypothetical protein
VKECGGQYGHRIESITTTYEIAHYQSYEKPKLRKNHRTSSRGGPVATPSAQAVSMGTAVPPHGSLLL